MSEEKNEVTTFVTNVICTFALLGFLFCGVFAMFKELYENQNMTATMIGFATVALASATVQVIVKKVNK